MKVVPFLAVILLSIAAQCQMKEGTIIFEKTTKMRGAPVNSDPAIAAQLAKPRVEQYELLFANRQSLWQVLPNVHADEPFGDGAVVIRFVSNNDISYHNFDAGTRTDQKELYDRTFLITDSITKGKWKLTDDTKKIKDHVVRKAISQRISTQTRVTMENGEMKRETVPDTAAIVAWFSADIPVPVGPEMQGQLPGAILEMDINDGQVVYTAVEISEKVNPKRVAPPKGGKKMTAAEFAIEREALMKEMRGNMQFSRTINVQ